MRSLLYAAKQACMKHQQAGLILLDAKLRAGVVDAWPSKHTRADLLQCAPGARLAPVDEVGGRAAQGGGQAAPEVAAAVHLHLAHRLPARHMCRASRVLGFLVSPIPITSPCRLSVSLPCVDHLLWISCGDLSAGWQPSAPPRCTPHVRAVSVKVTPCIKLKPTLLFK